MSPERQQMIRALFDEYIEMYASRDDRLTTRFSENFSGYAGSSSVLVKDREEWIKITRQDFAQVPERLGVEMLDLSMQEIGDNCAIVTAFFHIHLPLPDKFLSNETARLVLVFQREGADWKIAHSGISVPYRRAEDGEIYPIKSMQQRNHDLEAIVAERTQALERANRKLEELSNTDGLTGIANRRYFDRILQQEWNRAKRAGHTISLLMIDVDHFKRFNDNYGHLAGDACLQTFAQEMAKVARRGGELAARYGGEEFVMLLPDAAERDAVEIGRRIQEAVLSLDIPGVHLLPGTVTISIGIASRIPSKHENPASLVQQADRALYEAKRAGRNVIRTASERMA
ncbi:MAG: diguanylate cyclase [Oxalobacter sp.]|jgi:diguanylate cyclase (GGDEF)-like protein|nr:MAG: diguanylate cyclase [Oxalobacter sp.]